MMETMSHLQEAVTGAVSNRSTVNYDPVPDHEPCRGLLRGRMEMNKPSIAPTSSLSWVSRSVHSNHLHLCYLWWFPIKSDGVSF